MAVKIVTQDVHIDPAILFTRLFVLVERSEDPYLIFSMNLHYIQHLYSLETT